MRAVLEQQLGEHGRLCFVAKSPTDRSASAYGAKLSALRRQGVELNRHELLFLEVGMKTADPSTPTTAVVETEHGFQVLRVHGHAVPNAIAALLLAVAADLGVRPEIYLEWRERNPLRSALDYVAAGHGDVGPVLREVLRRAEPDRSSRPQVHLA
jgi:hypothetical protein